MAPGAKRASIARDSSGGDAHRRALAHLVHHVVEDPASGVHASVTVGRRPGRWSLVAVKLDAEQRRRQKAERSRVRDALLEAGFSLEGGSAREGPRASGGGELDVDAGA